MTRESVLIALGVLIALSPYLGLPLSVLGFLLPVLGLAVIGIGVTLRMRNQATIVPLKPAERTLPVYETTEA